MTGLLTDNMLEMKTVCDSFTDYSMLGMKSMTSLLTDNMLGMDSVTALLTDNMLEMNTVCDRTHLLPILTILCVRGKPDCTHIQSLVEA